MTLMTRNKRYKRKFAADKRKTYREVGLDYTRDTYDGAEVDKALQDNCGTCQKLFDQGELVRVHYLGPGVIGISAL